MVRRGSDCQVQEWLGVAWQARAGTSSPGMDRRDVVRTGRRGEACSGKSCSGAVRSGEAGAEWQVGVWWAEVRLVAVRPTRQRGVGACASAPFYRRKINGLADSVSVRLCCDFLCKSDRDGYLNSTLVEFPRRQTSDDCRCFGRPRLGEQKREFGSVG